jgi:benzoyl-CoA 2,3-dioxygenase component A
MLFFGARTQEELPYYGPLMKLPRDFIDINLAFSRTPGAPKRYVQDLLRDRAADVAAMLADASTCVYVCGLKAMESGVAAALREVANGHGLAWDECLGRMQREGRIHFETY